MGTHHTSPSRLASSPSQEKLSEYLAAHPDLIGASVAERFKGEGTAEGNLPFLFKILAIGKALSIQTHPDKAMAERLHKERPDVYKGTSHPISSPLPSRARSLRAPTLAFVLIFFALRPLLPVITRRMNGSR